jgi:hypothetical protein
MDSKRNNTKIYYFFDIYNNVFGLRPEHYESCDSCYGDLIKLSDKLFCPHCDKEIIKKITEELVKQTMENKNEN